MSTKKFLRDLKRQASVAGFETISVVSTRTSHFKITFTDGSQQWTMPVSSSPANYNHAIDNVIQDLRRSKRGAMA
jgi:hypothetical protein